MNVLQSSPSSKCSKYIWICSIRSVVANNLNVSLLILSLLSVFYSSHANARESLDISSVQSDINIAPFISFIKDEEHQLNIDDILTEYDQDTHWILNGAQVPNFGFSNAAYWLKLELSNSANTKQERLIEISYPLLESVEFYQVTNEQITKKLTIGHALPFANREIRHRNLVFRVELPSQASSVIYFKIEGNNAIQIPISMWSDRAFWEHDQKSLGIQAMYFGLMAVMMLYHIFIAWGTREKVYIYYVALIASVMVFIATQTGIAYQFFWSSATKWNSECLAILIPTCAGFAGIIVIDLLKLKEKSPVLGKIVHYHTIAAFLMVALYFVLPYYLCIALSTLLVVSSTVFNSINCILRWGDGEQDARIFILSWFLFIAGCCLLGLNKFAIVPFNFITESGAQLGSTIETVMLSLALASRINRLREDSLSLRQAELDAKEMELKAIEEMNEGKAKTQFLAMMSHEIRTPMNGVLGLVDVLKNTPLSENQKHLINTIQSSGEMLLTIINDILDFSKADADRLELEDIAVGLDQIIEECAQVYATKSHENNLLFMTHYADDAPKIINTDPTRIKQVINNLIGNAFKFTEHGHVFVSVHLRDKGNQYCIRVEIEDTGIGMNEEQQNRLFKSFSQADRTTTRRFGGTGLGLAISKKILEAMQGEIGVSSNEGKGTTFWFEIPIRAEFIVTPPKRNNKSILICTDYFPLVHIFNRSYDAHRYQIVPIILSGPHLFIQKPEQHFDRVVLYLNSNRYNPNEVIEKINAFSKPKTPFFLIQSDTQKADAIDTTEYLTLLHTPFEVHHFIDNINFKRRQDDRSVGGALLESASTLRVLVAEDNKINQMVIQGILTTMVHSVKVVSNGVEAVEQYQHNPKAFDLILMDCEMPEMDGYEATRRIREIESSRQEQTKLPIIALTAHALDEFKNQAISAGMNDYLPKPINAKILKEFFDNFCPEEDNLQKHAR